MVCKRKSTRIIAITSLIVVARIIFGPELGYYDALRDVLPFVLLSISFLLLATETTRLDFPRWVRRATRNKLGKDSRFAGFLAATGFFLLAGLYGWGVFELPARSPVGMPEQISCYQVWQEIWYRQPVGHICYYKRITTTKRGLDIASSRTTDGSLLSFQYRRWCDGSATRNDCCSSNGLGDGRSERCG